MFRQTITPRPNWQRRAKEFGFHFHTMYGEPYWDESAYYQFTLKQIEQDLEAPTEELHQMCLHVVDKVISDEELLAKFCIKPQFWQLIHDSWQRKEPSIYSRLDLVYDGTSNAKLYENNADTPTSVYESGFWQWLWLEDQVDKGKLAKGCDQFNSLQEKLIARFQYLKHELSIQDMHFSCCKDTLEDRGTVQYLQDCANAANLDNQFVFIEDIGLNSQQQFVDKQNNAIETLFKLYPWEFMFEEEYGEQIGESKVSWLEPAWKAIISNKALLPMLWKFFPEHPNLLPAYFEGESPSSKTSQWVKKPLFSREGANISIVKDSVALESSSGPYGKEGYIYQAFHPLPKFSNNYTLIGSWLVNDRSAGISIREDKGLITQDMSRFLPHVIL